MSTDLLLILPELTLFSLACLTLLFGSFFAHPGGGICPVRSYYLSQCSLAGVLLLLFLGFEHMVGQLAFGGSYIHDPVAGILKIAICLLTMLVFVYSRDYFSKHGQVRGEYYVLSLFSVLGMLIMVSANSLLTVYLGLELMSLSLYAMVAMHRESAVATEAAMKYFVLGAIASGMLLYGMSMLYGASATLNLDGIRMVAMFGGAGDSDWLFYGTIFIIVGICFKLGAVPFHMWLPDIYQGSPSAVTAFIAGAPKIAAFAMLLRLLFDALWPLVYDWQQVLMSLSVLSMLIGNIVAIAQSNMKRMLAWSGIAHSGFVLLGVASGEVGGFAASMFYVIVYALMSTCVFGMLILLGVRGEPEFSAIDGCRGLSVRSPWFALLLLFLMFSMAGVPPFVGFWAKWFVLSEAVRGGHVPLAVVAVVASVIGAFYYLRIVRLMYFETDGDADHALDGSRLMRWALSIQGLAILLLGLAPGLLLGLCSQTLMR